MPLFPINLFSGVTSADTCSANTITTTDTYYLSGSSQIEVGNTAYTDSLGTINAPDGFYVTNGYRQTWGQITGGNGVFSLTGICWDCHFTGYTICIEKCTTFKDCCNPGFIFNVLHELGTFTVGEVYYLETLENYGFTGCATVLEVNVCNPCNPTYSVLDGTEENDCCDCKLNHNFECAEFICEKSIITVNTAGLTPYDGEYVMQGSQGYNNYSYFISQNSPNRVIYFDGAKWCLSDTLGGECLLTGNEPCNGICPDFCDVSDYVCTTTTPNPCDVVDFEALFDCDPTPTSTPTPTITPSMTPTPTMTPTPSATDICGYVLMELTCEIIGPTPTATPTPSVTPQQVECDSQEITTILLSLPFECPPQK